MFSVSFEVHPKSDQWDAYLGYAKMLRTEPERIDGFVDNIRYRSLTREGWILSLSEWRDEKALVSGGRGPSTTRCRSGGAPWCSSTTACSPAARRRITTPT